MRPILKKRPGEVSCQSTLKFLTKICSFKSGGHRQKRRDSRPARLKTRVQGKHPHHLTSPSNAFQNNADSPVRLSPAHSQGLAETAAKYFGRQKIGARLGELQKAKKNRNTVTFTFTSTDLGTFPSYIDDYFDETSSQGSVFNPELITAHCFKQLKKKDFHLPRSRRRIIIVPGTKDQPPSHPTTPPQAPSPPIVTFKAMNIEDLQEPPPVDKKVWLSQRAKLRKQLDSFGDVKKWLENKPSITPSEAKVLLMIRQEQKVPKDTLTSIRRPKSKAPKPIRQPIPQLRLPKPSILADTYAYLRSRKIKILDLFGKVERGENQRISREEFIMALKAIGVPLKNQELEDLVIYLGSLGKQNAITTDALSSTYKQWSLTQQRSILPTAREYYSLSVKRASLKQMPPKQQPVPTPQPPKMDLLTVPEVDTKMEGRPMTEEDMEDVGKRYRERQRQCKLSLPAIQYVESCRLVRSGLKPFDDHCLPSTLSGEMEELLNLNRRDDFLVYLKCWELCKAYGLPLTEDILMRALLYPGDKIISLKEEVRPIRQPGGYYIDERLGFRTRGLRLGAKKTDKKTSKKLKKMYFEEFEEFTRKLKANRLIGHSHTHPNHFWPGHLLDKLQLYLPTVARDQSQAIFSCVEPTRCAYPTTYHHSRDWWPVKDWAYMTHAYYDANKVYSIN